MQFSARGGGKSGIFSKRAAENHTPDLVQMVEFQALDDSLLKAWSKTRHQIQKSGRNPAISKRSASRNLILDAVGSSNSRHSRVCFGGYKNIDTGNGKGKRQIATI